MADIQIAIKAKNEASAAINQVSADMTGLAKTTQAATTSFANTPQLTQGLQKTSADVRAISESLQQAAKEAEGFNRSLSQPARVQNAGGVEAMSAGIKTLHAELTATLKETEQLAKAGKLDFGAGADANVAKVRQAVGQMRGELKNLDSAAKSAAKAGVLGDAAGPTQSLANIGRQAQTLRTSLSSVSSQAKQTAVDVANVGKNANLGAFKAQVGEIDGALSRLGNVLSGGGLGLAAGAIGLGATVAAAGQLVAGLESAVQAAGKVSKLRDSFDQLANAAGASGDDMLNAMRTASNGMVTDADLILSANKAMLLGVADSAQEMTALLEIARARGQAMGLEVGQAFNDIVTGLGRESALILDNLGITIDAASAMDTYAASIGRTADQLSTAERKQALLNAVMEQSKGISAKAPTGPGAAAAQADVARQNAQVVVGDFFGPVFREYYDAQTDFINQSLGRWDGYAQRVRDVNQVAADFAGDDRNDPKQVQRFADLAAALNTVQQALAAGVPNAQAYADALNEIGGQALLTRSISEQTANTIGLAANGIRAEAEAYATLRATLDQLDPKLEQNRQRVQDVATAEQIAADAATLAKYSMDAFAASMVTANAQAQAMAGGLSQVQAQAGATSGVIYNLAGAMERLRGVSNVNISAPDALDRILPQINNLGGGLVDNLGLDGAIAKTNELKIANRDLYETLQAQGYTEDQIYFALSANVQETQKWASSLDGVSEQAQKAKEQFDDIQGKVAGLIAEARDLPSFKASDLFDAKQLEGLGIGGDSAVSVDQAANGGRVPDSINENAKRLMAIAKEGLTDQSWLEEFKREVPEVFAELENNPDIRGTALRILQEFQNGMRPELLDRGMIKDRVKTMILGEQNAAALAGEIAQEIAGELGISLQQAMSATNTALGIGTGEGAGGSNVAAPDMTPQGELAGASLRAGMIAGFDAGGMTVAIVAKIDAEFSNPKNIDALKKSGGTVGAMWGAGFLNTVGSNIPPGLYDVLVSGLVPLIVAAIGAQGTRTGAQP
jgi:hypothetical protein